MFAEGQQLRAEHGDDGVIDLSLGQPSGRTAGGSRGAGARGAEDFPGRNAYMPNLGYPELRERAAEDVACAGVTSACIAMTGGAAGRICLALRAFLDVG